MEPFGLVFPGKASMLGALRSPANSWLRLQEERCIRHRVARHALVEGDNLQALQVLHSAYFGRFKAVYLDPPYNTGRDFVYRDRFAEGHEAFLQRTDQTDELGEALVANPTSHGRHHSAWLSMMYPRLWWIRQLMADDGVLFCSIDDHEVHRLRMLLDEIFGEECFIAQIVVVTNRGGRDYLRIATGHEYLLCYGASPRAPIYELPRSSRGDLADARGSYELRELRNRNPKFTPHNRPNLHYPIHVHPERGTEHGEHAVSLDPGGGHEIEVRPRNSRGEGSVWRWGRPKVGAAIVGGDPHASDVVAKQRRDGGWNIYEKTRKRTTKPRALWDDAAVRTEQGTADLRSLLGEALFDHPKPVELVARCLQIATRPGDLVLDPFAGSGTTLQAVERLNASDEGGRAAVLLQLPEPTPEGSAAARAEHRTVADICRARIAAVLADRPDAGLRSFRLMPDESKPVPRSAGLLIDALRDREAVREQDAPRDVWHRACRQGLALHAKVRQHGSFEVLVDQAAGRLLAWTTDQTVTREHVEALELPAGSCVIVPDQALDDACRVALASRWRVESW